MISCPQCNQTTHTCNDCGGALEESAAGDADAQNQLAELTQQLSEREADYQAELARREVAEKELAQAKADIAILLEEDTEPTPPKQGAKKTTSKGK